MGADGSPVIVGQEGPRRVRDSGVTGPPAVIPGMQTAALTPDFNDPAPARGQGDPLPSAHLGGADTHRHHIPIPTPLLGKLGWPQLCFIRYLYK